MFFCFCFFAAPCGTLVLLLALQSEINPGRIGIHYGMLGIKPESTLCKAFFFFLPSFLRLWLLFLFLLFLFLDHTQRLLHLALCSRITPGVPEIAWR